MVGIRNPSKSLEDGGGSVLWPPLVGSLPLGGTPKGNPLKCTEMVLDLEVMACHIII